MLYAGVKLCFHDPSTYNCFAPMKYLFLTIWSMALAGAFAAQEPAQTESQDPLRASLEQKAPSGASATESKGPLVWDEMTKEITAAPSQTTNLFIFWVTNTATTNILIHRVSPECECTTVKLPKEPWLLTPNESAPLYVTINFANQSGQIRRGVEVSSSEGEQHLTIKVNVALTQDIALRQKRLDQARLNRQSIFKGECAACHLDKGKGRTGEELLAADCAICHDTPHQADGIPKLSEVNKITSKVYWKWYLENGGRETIMPSFSVEQGGPLTAQEIDAFADFLNKKFPPKDKSKLKPVSAR